MRTIKVITVSPRGFMKGKRRRKRTTEVSLEAKKLHKQRKANRTFDDYWSLIQRDVKQLNERYETSR